MSEEGAKLYDCIIIGGGPAGLSAAIYAGREGMDVVVVDKGAFGGMAALTETIDNYPGFSKGVGGQELIDEMTAQAERFGAISAPYTEVTSLEPGDGICKVVCGDDEMQTRAVLITTGSTYRKMNVPGEEELIGRGLHFCATCDGPLYKGKNVIVVGGGNSALQESLFLARFADSVTILVRGADFSGSDVLKEQVLNEPRIQVQYNIQVGSLHREKPGMPIVVTATLDGVEKQLKADGIFVFVGLIPNTHGLAGVPTDEQGFILSDMTYRTHFSNVFVAGDVRSGSTWQIGSAVGEGVSAALAVRHYLDKEHPAWHKK